MTADTATPILDAALDATAARVTPWSVNLRSGSSSSVVSQQWYSRKDDERFTRMSDLYAYVKARFEACTSAVIRNRDIQFVAPMPADYTELADQHLLSIELPDGSMTKPSHWSFGQVAGLAGAPAAYLRTLPGYIVAEALTYGMRVNREVEHVKPFYQPAGEMHLCAVTGPDYGRIPDHEVVAAVQQITGPEALGEMGWKVPGMLNWSTGVYDPLAPVTKRSTTLFASDRDIFLFLVDDLHPIEIGKLPDGSPDLVFRGFYVQHSEVGSKPLRIGVFYYRFSCENRILWGIEEFEEIEIRHSKFAPDRFVMTALPALKAFANGSSRLLTQGVAAAQALRVAKDEEEVLDFLQARKFTRPQAHTIAALHEAEEGRPIRSVWDAANGITAFARKSPHQDARFDLERRAQTLLETVKLTA